MDAQEVTRILVETIHEDGLLPKDKVVADGAYINFSTQGHEREMRSPPCQEPSSFTTISGKRQFSMSTRGGCSFVILWIVTTIAS